MNGEFQRLRCPKEPGMIVFSRTTAMTAAILVISAIHMNASAQDSDKLPKTVETAIGADKDCQDYNAVHLRKARVSARLGETQTLFLLPCFTGAYYVVYRVYVFDTRYPRELRPSLFASYSDEMGWSGTDSLINADYDEKTKTLTAFEKGRGLGDCGSIPTYQWAEYGWRMTEYRYWGKCDGTRMPEKWPVIYRFKKPKD